MKLIDSRECGFSSDVILFKEKQYFVSWSLCVRRGLMGPLALLLFCFPFIWISANSLSALEI